MVPRFAIVGTGRSGSAYISQVLTEAGIACAHESWWNPEGAHDETIVGDSSCCALPLGLDDYDGIVLHQLRHPLDSILSYIRVPVREPHLSLIGHLVPHADPADMLDFGMHAWLNFARAAQRLEPALWWSVEKVTAALVRRIGDRVGIAVSAATARCALKAVPHTFNQHYLNREPRLTWNDLDDHDPVLAGEIVACARRYGYDRE